MSILKSSLTGSALLAGALAIAMLAMAGSLAAKRHVPESAGTLPTHTPLFVTLLACVVIVVGALIAAAAEGSPVAKWLGLLAVAFASVNIFGGFAVTERMLAMYKKKG